MKNRFRWGIVFLCMLLFVGSCGKRADKTTSVVNSILADSLERSATDSLFVNNAYARQLLRKNMVRMPDSIVYYRLLAMYAKACFAASDFDSVLYYKKQIDRFCSKMPASSEVNDVLSVACNLVGNVWIQRMRPDSAIAYYQQAYQLQMKGSDLDFLPDLCINLADAHHLAGDYAQDALYYRRALFLCDSLALPDIRKFPIYCGLGQVYMELRDFELSNHYYEMASPFLSRMNPYERWNYFTLRGNHFYYKKEYPEAERYIGQSLRVLEKYPQMVFERHLSMANLGELFMLNGKLDSAQLYLNQSDAYFTEMKNTSALYYIETQKIELALKQGDIGQASKMITRTVPDGSINVNMISIRNQYLKHYYERTGDYKRAYEYQKEDLKLDDSLRNEGIRTRIAELTLRYQQDTTVMRREVVIARQSKEMNVLRLISYICALGCGLLMVDFVSFYWFMKKKRLFLQQRHLSQIGRLRMENIRNHISPHFTFNVLNREISSFKGSEEERNGLVNLVKILRKSLELTEKLAVSLSEELDFVQTYLSLERSRLGEGFVLTVEVDEHLNQEQITIPSMIIQIPVENAIKHGLVGIEREQRLGIKVADQGNGLRITVIDNGRGYLPQALPATKGTGTGLKVLYQTLQLLNARNRGEKILFEITNLTGGQQTGTCVSVYVPYNYVYDL